MKKAAFFDLDRTLLLVNSGALWMKRERRAGRITFKQVTEATLMLVEYRLSIIDIEASVRKALAVYKGEQEKNLDLWTREWFEEEVSRCISPGARPVLEEHRAAGHLLILLTSSSPYLSAAVSKHLSLDDWISSSYEVQNGIFTGEPIIPLCYGSGKVAYAEAYARGAGIDLDHCFFYSDSFTDLPMLQRVGEPRVVNPDLRLRLYARWRGWPVLDWRAAGL